MSTPICSFCLAANRKMINIDNIELRRIFDRLINIEADNELQLDLSLPELTPRSLCFMCHWQLQRCRRFARRALRSGRVLREIADKGLEATQETLTSLNIETAQNLTIHTEVTTLDYTTEDIIKHVPVKEESYTESTGNAIPTENHLYHPMELELSDIPKAEDTYDDDYDDTKPLLPDETEADNPQKDLIYSDTQKVKKKKVKTKCKICKKCHSNSSHKCRKPVKRKDSNTEDLTCDLCNKVFSDKYVLRKHIRIHSGEKPYVCEKCDRAFLLPTYLRDHMLRTHTESREFICSECPKSFTVKNTLLKHIKRLHSGKTHTCDRCARAFNNNSDLKSHMVVHTNERPHVCATCGKAFKRKNQLNEHIKSHNGARCKASQLFECVHCDKKYSLRASLFNHMKSHTGMMYTCDRCAVSCRDRSTLKVHMLIHSDERPHACPTCGKAFKRRSQLKEHAKVHTGERPYACDLCEKTFTQKGSLNFHKRVHTGQRPFICEVCGRTFDNKYNMAAHLRVHTGERPHACAACARRFARRGGLADHVRKHHAAHRYTCDECCKTYAHRNTLMKHMKIHLREK